jgi:predicted NBD/HSP70 family sugar kinase
MSAMGDRAVAVSVSDVRRHHLAVVLGRLLRDGPRSRAELSRATGLTKATVSALVADLLARGLVTETAAPSGAMGRPATRVAAEGSSVVSLGMQIEVDHVSACVVDLTGNLRVLERRRQDNRTCGTGAVLARLAEVTSAVLAGSIDSERRVVGAGVAVPGLVEPLSGEVLVAPNLAWSQLELSGLAGRLGLRSGIEVVVDNEANLAALAELDRWDPEVPPSFVHVSGGVGVGAGIVVEGHLLRGVHGFGGEIGHLVVDPDGRRCACGARGCLETVVGAERSASTDERARALVRALIGVVHLLDPAAIVLGGSFAGDDELAQLVAQQLHEETLAGRSRPCRVRASALGADAALLGAARRGLEGVLADPTTIPTRRVAPTC